MFPLQLRLDLLAVFLGRLRSPTSTAQGSVEMAIMLWASTEASKVTIVSPAGKPRRGLRWTWLRSGLRASALANAG
ncbi:hypothetical protein CLCR_02183 [Cladophialophora carrionii]|uniref:Secreted protein n=1 Tax=Cladophialophora carrionii TaxID=86049 RepID=A0A1C1CDS8_9EURO|nr:hypothetical protein CLCR_02183 [Cladophialophora carrionii]